jgi:LAS superfamily LD-carboxypeptidase LdcB
MREVPRIRLGRIPNGRFLRADAAAAFNRMYRAARRSGVRLFVVSGYRPPRQQARLYQLYDSSRGNLAAPSGRSNHNRGIAVDIATGQSTRTPPYRWLTANAPRFGFVRAVPSEPWHWVYQG